MPKVSEILPWLDAHGVVLTAVVAALVAAWKAIPAKTREALERAFPRVAGVVRFVVSVGPDVLGALRIGWYQVLQGVPRASVGGAPLPLTPEQHATVEAAVTPYAPPRAVEPDTARHRRSGETTQTMRALDQGDRAMRGYLRLPGWYRRGLRAASLAVHRVAIEASALREWARLRWLVCLVCLALAALLAGCPLPPVDGCRPGATRCTAQGIPQRCSGTGRWWQEPTAQTCSTFGATCCLAASPYGGSVHACVPAVACVPSPAGPTSSPSALAETQ